MACSREELFIDSGEAVNGTIELCGEAATVYTLALGQAPQLVIGSVARETPAFRCSRVRCRSSEAVIYCGTDVIYTYGFGVDHCCRFWCCRFWCGKCRQSIYK